MTRHPDPEGARSICVAESRRSESQFEDQVHRRLRGAAQVGKPGFPRHLAQTLFARLRAKAEPDLLRRPLRNRLSETLGL